MPQACIARHQLTCQVVVGTKTGELVLFDIVTSSQLASYKAHSGAIWGIHVRPDGRGLVSGSADKDVKFWDFEMREVESEGDRVVDRLGRETVVSPSLGIWCLVLSIVAPNELISAVQDKAIDTGTYPNIENDRRRPRCQVLSGRSTIGGRALRLNSQNLLSRYPEILLIAIWTQSTPPLTPCFRGRT
jgi:WD40 repeat protein